MYFKKLLCCSLCCLAQIDLETLLSTGGKNRERIEQIGLYFASGNLINLRKL